VPTIDVILDANTQTPAWPDVLDRGFVHVPDATWRLAALAGGMASGAPSLALRIDVPLNTLDEPVPIIAETSLAAWIAATCALRGRYPEAFEGGPLDPHLGDVAMAHADRAAQAIVALEDGDPQRALRVLTNQE
jgi:hypothetical protein